ncbi:MAG: hypothetical protein LBO00_02150 [Zoogloeaceae bacterium]|jgi:hypothetical protein|nr:hypothetical protein [Zoogloeaceae bacterium]
MPLDSLDCDALVFVLVVPYGKRNPSFAVPPKTMTTLPLWKDPRRFWRP